MRILRYTLLIIIAGFVFASCDKLEPPYCEIAPPPIPGDTIFKKVLLEEYTGFRCPNCPNAAAEAHDLKHLYGDRLVVMAMHVGVLAMPVNSPFDYDFRTSTASTWDNFFGPSAVGLPKGMVNRIGYPVQANYILDYGNWGSLISQIIYDSADANIEIHSTLNESTRQIDVSIDAYFYSQLNGNYYVNVCIIEDSIVKPQKDANLGDILDYNHMHALRGSISSVWGDSLTANPTADSSNFISKSFPTYTIANDRVLKNCSLIAFIYRRDAADNNQYEVIQAEEKRIK